jgi:hypothetical protein
MTGKEVSFAGLVGLFCFNSTSLLSSEPEHDLMTGKYASKPLNPKPLAPEPKP